MKETLVKVIVEFSKVVGPNKAEELKDLASILHNEVEESEITIESVVKEIYKVLED